MRVPRVALSLLAAALALAGVAAQAPPPTPTTQAQQRPVFRGGTHFVRVDAYPTVDGKIVENLKPEDFEVLEDGKPQKIESFDFLKFDGFTPDVERKDPSSQRAGFDMAADPRYRVFVVYVDLAASTSPGAVVPNEDLPRIRQPLVNFLDRIMGNRDLFGFLTSRNSVKDLVFAQKTTVTVAAALDLWRAKVIDRDNTDEAMDGCLSGPGKAIRRIDQSYETLEMLVTTLGSIRQERKIVVLVSNVLTRAKIPLNLLDAAGGQMPKAGITAGGRIGIGNREGVGVANQIGCTSEVQRLAGMDFDARYRELLRSARRENVAFYPITPAGLQAPVTKEGIDYVKQTTDDLISLANETDGVAIVNTNDMNAGFRRIADDLAAYYVLGYYTTNTKFDGGLRNIKVRYKSNGGAIRARRQYRAPTEAEIAALSAPRSSATATSAAPAARAAITLVQQPKAYLVRPKAEPAPADVLRLMRADRLRVEWTVVGAVDQRTARILDRTGKPLPFDVPLADNDAARTLTVELPLAPFARGDYSVELTVGSGSIVERSLLAFRVQ